MSLGDARLRAARAAIAAACLESLPDGALGSVRLRADQRRLLARAARALDDQGGCLIGEDVGRGKTFVALALARRWSRPLVVVPASLRTTWRVAMERAEVACAVVSHEGLSHGRLPTAAFDGIVVDESHHFRTPATRRYDALARMTARVPVVLLSATPLQNRARDLAAQVALFHGERAFSLDVQSLARFVIRGDDTIVAGMPTVRAPEWLTLEADDGAVLRAILDLPPPARPLDGGDAGALRTIGLVRAWASSRAALQAALRSRRRVATAIAQGAEVGRAPTRLETRAWHAAEDVVQLGFPAILMTGSAAGDSLAELRVALDDDARAMDRLADVLRAAPDPDEARVAAIRRLRIIHGDARIIAFSERASTVAATFAAMRGDAGVGMLTASEARIATGRIARDELLARFAPLAQHARPAAAHDSVTLLLATDLLSEGVNLQDAGVVLHLDLPWNPARLAQRVGRLRRPGGGSEVRTYLLAPPAGAAALLDADARLRRKIAEAEQVIGAGFPVMPPLLHSATDALYATGSGDDVRSSATSAGAFVSRLDDWRIPAWPPGRSAERCIISGVCGPIVGSLAALGDGRVLATLGGDTSESIADLLRLTGFAVGQSRRLAPGEAHAALFTIRAWLDADRLAATCGLADQPGPLRRTVLDWAAALVQRLRRHEHATALPLIAQLRDCLRAPFALGAERLLAECVTGARGRGADVMTTLDQMLRIVDGVVRRAPVAEPRERPEVVALILIREESVCRDRG